MNKFIIGDIERENAMGVTIKIIVAAHKPYEMPDDEVYLPVYVGAMGKTDVGYQRDDEGENISILNPYFCELTGLYWAWKNLSEDYIGLVHYRRLFEIHGKPITKKEIEPYLGDIKVFIPKKRHYYIETLKSHYNHTHSFEHLDITKTILIRKYSEYEDVYERVCNRTWGYMFNMMVMEKKILSQYCMWLFDILFDVFKQIDATDYSTFSKRYIGRISELLFNVWLEQELDTGNIRKEEIMELNCNMKENWLVKIPAFLKAKFLGKKYERSF